MYVDSHAHLDLLEQDPLAALAEAREAGVGPVVAVGIDLASSRQAAEAASSLPDVMAAVGIHPNEAGSAGEDDIEELETLARQPGVAAIGETGLDYYHDRAPSGAQKELFLAHIDLARRLRLPLVVHTRESGPDTLEILSSEANGLTVILHCFSLIDAVEACAERGYLMSFAGNVTFPKADGLRAAATRVPAHLLLTETDSPFLTPVPFRGKPNRPARVPLIAAELARLRGEDAAELAGRVLKNFRSTFGPVSS